MIIKYYESLRILMNICHALMIWYLLCSIYYCYHTVINTLITIPVIHSRQSCLMSISRPFLCSCSLSQLVNFTDKAWILDIFKSMSHSLCKTSEWYEHSCNSTNTHTQINDKDLFYSVESILFYCSFIWTMLMSWALVFSDPELWFITLVKYRSDV